MNTKQQAVIDRAKQKALAKALKKLTKLGGPEDVLYAVDGQATKGKDVVGVLYITNDGTTGFSGRNGLSVFGSKDTTLDARGITVNAGAILAKIDISTPDGRFRVKNVPKYSALAFKEAWDTQQEDTQ